VSFLVVPVDIPALAGVDVDHFLPVDFEHVKLFLLRDELLDFIQRAEIHEVSCVYCII